MRSTQLLLALGIVLALAMSRAQEPPDPVPSDWRQIYVGASAMLHGADPYTAVDSANIQPYPTPYPGSAFLVAAPFALLPWRIAVALWCGLSGGLFAFAVTRRGLWGLYALLAAPFFNAY